MAEVREVGGLQRGTGSKLPIAVCILGQEGAASVRVGAGAFQCF